MKGDEAGAPVEGDEAGAPVEGTVTTLGPRPRDGVRRA